MKNCSTLVSVALITTLVLPTRLFPQWVQTSIPYSKTQVYALAANSTYLFAGTYHNGIYRTTDNGANWTPANNGLGSLNVYSLAVSDANLFAGTEYGVYRSTDNGGSWTSVGLNPYTLYALAVKDTFVFAGTQNDAYRSTNNGSSWTAGNCSCSYVDAFVFVGTSSGTNIYAGSRYNGVFLSTNNGASWTVNDSGLTSTKIFALAGIFPAVPTDLFAGTLDNGVFRSVNNGQRWAAFNAGWTINCILALTVSNSCLFAGTCGWNSGNNIFLLTDIGTRWASVSDGLSATTITSVYTFTTVDTILFAGTDDGVWRRPLSEMVITGCKDDAARVPKEVTLGQNFPNPFNPATVIHYSVPARGFVSLKVFNLLGQEVATLVEETKEPGTYAARWDAGASSSGVYFCRLQSSSATNTGEKFTQVRKMILVK